MTIKIADTTPEQSLLSALESIMQGVSNTYGEDFYRAITQQLAQSIGADFTFIGRFDDGFSHSRTLALCAGTELIDNFQYELCGTPCAKVAEESTCVYPDKVCDAFPYDQLLIDMEVKGYIGAPLLNRQKKVIGLIVALYKNKIQNETFVKSIFELFAGRIAAEIENSESTEALDNLNQTLEQQVAERTTALIQANEELTSFSYALSHDLRAPLRATTGLLKIIKEDYIQQLSSEAKIHFDQVDDSCLHMAAIIDDMLKLAKLSSKKLNQSIVNITEVCNSIIEKISDTDNKNNDDIVIDDNMHIHGDKALITIMLHNIIDNAWKFSSEKAERRIRIQQHNSDNHQTIIISDNGIGFNSNSANELYRPFHKLHNSSKYSGAGIGLSTVKKVVDRHQANISINSKVNSGTKVSIEWPKPIQYERITKILVIEDNPVDFLLLYRLIKKHLGNIQIFRSENKASSIEMLKTPWPLIVADCNIMDAEVGEIVSWIKESKSKDYILVSGSPEKYQNQIFDPAPIDFIDKSDTKAISKTLLMAVKENNL